MALAEQRRPDTIADFLARADDEYIELIRGTIVEKASPTSEHAGAQLQTGVALVNRFQRGGGRPGGWVFFTELDVQLAGEVFRPDVCGYRVERWRTVPKGRLAPLVPDWVCEILSVSNESRDRVEKMESYFRAGLPHYWLIDPVEGILEVYRRTDLAYARVQVAHRGQRIRAEPFETAELSVDELLGEEPTEE